MYCDRCFEDYPDGEYRKSNYFNDKIFCIPCEHEYEMKLKNLNIKFLNNQPKRLNPEDAQDTRPLAQGMRLTENEIIKEMCVCDSPTPDNK